MRRSSEGFYPALSPYLSVNARCTSLHQSCSFKRDANSVQQVVITSIKLQNKLYRTMHALESSENSLFLIELAKSAVLRPGPDLWTAL